MTAAELTLLNSLIAQAQGNLDFLEQFLVLTGQSPQVMILRNSAAAYLAELQALLPA